MADTIATLVVLLCLAGSPVGDWYEYAPRNFAGRFPDVHVIIRSEQGDRNIFIWEMPLTVFVSRRDTQHGLCARWFP